MTGRISVTPAEDGTCKFVTMHSAINGHWSQSMGAVLSGQHGISAAIYAAAISGTDPPMVMPAFAGPESGANTRPAITRIASSRERWNDIFTPAFSHVPAAMGTETSSGGITNSVQFSSFRGADCVARITFP